MRLSTLVLAGALLAPLSAEARPSDFTFMCIDTSQLAQASEASCHRVNYMGQNEQLTFCKQEYGSRGAVFATYSEQPGYSSAGSSGEYAGFGPDACVDQCMDLSFDTDGIRCRTRGRPFDER